LLITRPIHPVLTGMEHFGRFWNSTGRMVFYLAAPPPGSPGPDGAFRRPPE